MSVITKKIGLPQSWHFALLQMNHSITCEKISQATALNKPPSVWEEACFRCHLWSFLPMPPRRLLIPIQDGGCSARQHAEEGTGSRGEPRETAAEKSSRAVWVATDGMIPLQSLTSGNQHTSLNHLPIYNSCFISLGINALTDIASTSMPHDFKRNNN